MEDNEIIDLLVNKLKAEDIWFTQKADPTFGEAPDYFKLDEYGDLQDVSVKQVAKEIKSLIGDGAVDIDDAIELWIQDAMVDNKVAYKDILVTKFKDKPVVDGIEAYENPVQLGESKKVESRPQWSGWDNISINIAAESQLLQYQLDTDYKVDYYVPAGGSFIKSEQTIVNVPASAFKGNVTDKQVEEYIKKQLPKDATIEGISYRYYEDEKAMNKRLRQFLGKSKSQVDKEEKEAEEISYLQDRILDYERKGRGTKQQYEKDLDRLHKLQGLDENKELKNEDAEYDEYMKAEKESAEKYKAELYSNITDKMKNNFNELKDIIDEDEDLVDVDGWYFPERALAIVSGGNLNYHLNQYMDLTPANILNDVKEYDSIEAVIDSYFEEYKSDSAYSWASNFLDVINSIDTSMQKSENEVYVLITEFEDADYFDEFKTDEEAVEYAKANDYIRVEKETYYYDYNGDDLTYGEPDTEVIWEAEDLDESKEIKIEDVDKDKYPTPTGDIVEYHLSNDKSNPVWIVGYVVSGDKKYNVNAKVFLKGSTFGIDEGPVSKFWIISEDGGETIVNYDRGWDVTPSKENEELFNAVYKLVIDFRNANPYEVKEENVNFNKSTKDKKEENTKRRLKEENNKSANLISQMIQDANFDAESNAGKIILRTSALFNALSEKGYDVQVAFDNGDSTSAILLGQQGGQVIITINNDKQPLKSFASGNFEINNENIEVLKNIAEIVETI